MKLKRLSRPFVGRLFQQAAFAAVFVCVVAGVRAQIPVNAGVNPTITFDGTTTPPASEFATRNAGVGADGTGTFTTPESMDAGAQSVNASDINSALQQTTANGTHREVRHNTSAGYLTSQPTGVGATVLRATLQNTSGGGITEVTITYDFGVAGATTTETAYGFRAYYSLSGAAGSWQVIPEFSGLNAAATVSKTLSMGFWAPEAQLHLLWMDDNAATNPDGIYTIDNFRVTAVPGVSSPVVITNSPVNASAPERGSATFTVVAGGSPRDFHWQRRDAGAPDFSPIPGAHQSSYTITNLAYPADNGAQFRVVVSNSFGAQTSAAATLTVIPDTTPPTVVSAVGLANPNFVLVTFSENILPGDLVDGANFIVYRRGGNPGESLGTANVTLQNGNQVLVETVSPRDVAGHIDYDIQIWDQRDASSGQNEIVPNPTVAPVQVNYVLASVDEGHPENMWKWFMSASTDLWTTAPNWMRPGFDDSTWQQGPAGLGLDSSANGVPIRTPLPYTAQSEPGFFRRTVILPADPSGVTLTARYLFEDGAVVYINGQPALRVNVPADPLTFASRAPAGATDPTPLSASVNLPTTNLVAGENTIAVVVLQNGATSSDVEMALELIARFTTFAAGAPQITTPLVNRIVDEGGNVTFSVSVTGGVPLQYQWYKGTDIISGATSSSYTITGVRPDDSGTYRVVVTNNDGNAESSATLTVVPDTTGPVFVSAVGDPSLTNIVLTIVDRSGLRNVDESSNYSITPVGGGTDLNVLSATVTSSSNIVLHTTPRVQGQNYDVTVFDVTDNSVAQNPLSPDTIRLRAEVIVLQPDDSTLWRFDSTSNSLDGVAWQLPGFDDSAWGSGLAGFTTDTGEIVPEGFELRTTNMVAVNVGGPPVTYFRVKFNMPGDVSSATLRITGVVDDGLVAYINGVEAGRIRITNASPVSFTNFATAASPEASNLHSLSDVVLTNLSGLVAGENTLAIQLHQNNMTSSDAVLSIQLIAGVLEFGDGPTSCPPLRIARNEAGQVTISWTGGDGCILQETTALNGAATVWTTSSRQNGVPFTPPAGPGARFYRLCSGNCN